MHQNISDHLDASDDLLVRAWHDPAVTNGCATNSDDTLLYLPHPRRGQI